MDRVTQGQCTQHSADHVVLMSKAARKNSIAEIDKGIFARLSGIDGPAFNPDTEVTMEEIFQVDTAAPRVIGLEVGIILPVVRGKNIGSPQTDVKLVIGVPLRTRWRGDLFYFFSGIGFSGKSSRSDYA